MKLILFYAKWSGPSEAMLKAIEDSEIEVELIDATMEPEAAHERQVRGLPTLIMFDDTMKELKRLLGAVSSKRIKEWL